MADITNFWDPPAEECKQMCAAILAAVHKKVPFSNIISIVEHSFRQKEMFTEALGSSFRKIVSFQEDTLGKRDAQEYVKNYREKAAEIMSAGLFSEKLPGSPYRFSYGERVGANHNIGNLGMAAAIPPKDKFTVDFVGKDGTVKTTKTIQVGSKPTRSIKAALMAAIEDDKVVDILMAQINLVCPSFTPKPTLIYFSANPLDILLSSHFSSFSSCHKITDGAHRTGPVQYCLDNTSGIMFVARKSKSDNASDSLYSLVGNEKIREAFQEIPRKIYRQMFYVDWDREKLALSRMYPDRSLPPGTVNFINKEAAAIYEAMFGRKPSEWTGKTSWNFSNSDKETEDLGDTFIWQRPYFNSNVAYPDWVDSVFAKNNEERHKKFVYSPRKISCLRCGQGRFPVIHKELVCSLCEKCSRCGKMIEAFQSDVCLECFKKSRRHGDGWRCGECFKIFSGHCSSHSICFSCNEYAKKPIFKCAGCHGPVDQETSIPEVPNLHPKCTSIFIPGGWEHEPDIISCTRCKSNFARRFMFLHDVCPLCGESHNAPSGHACCYSCGKWCNPYHTLGYANLCSPACIAIYNLFSNCSPKGRYVRSDTGSAVNFEISKEFLDWMLSSLKKGRVPKKSEIPEGIDIIINNTKTKSKE